MSLIRREWSVPVECEDNGVYLTLMQFNVLADGLAKGSFTKTPEEFLEWSFRCPKIVQAIRSCSADLVVLEEVNHFDELMEELSKDDYEGVFFPKPKSPCLDLGFPADGIAILFKKAYIELIVHDFRAFTNDDGSEMNQGYVTCAFACQGFMFHIVGTHLKSKSPFESIRVKQCEQLVRRMSTMESPVFLLGDFNAEPEGDAISVITSSGYRDSYKELLLDSHAYTTWKVRDLEVSRIIDYIFFKENYGKIKPLSALEMPHRIPESRFPSFNWPSDHLSLCVRFKIG